jgi:hypothetical protein
MKFYFGTFYHAKTLAILDRNQDELQQIQQIAETRYRVRQGSAAGPIQRPDAVA